MALNFRGRQGNIVELLYTAKYIDGKWWVRPTPTRPASRSITSTLIRQYQELWSVQDQLFLIDWRTFFKFFNFCVFDITWASFKLLNRSDRCLFGERLVFIQPSPFFTARFCRIDEDPRKANKLKKASLIQKIHTQLLGFPILEVNFEKN
jgi:hypothetical protein